jgi:hypothetical protein
MLLGDLLADASYAHFAVGMVPAQGAATSSIEGIKVAVNPWAACYVYLNMAETRPDRSTSGPRRGL